jgi:small subunit ribosomal protein S8
MTTDPLADLLTRIRNALASKHKLVSVPFSSIKENIVKLMIKNGYLKGYQLEGEKPHLNIIIKLKYKAKVSKITSLIRLSKPGVRVYSHVKELPKLMRGRGILIISTSKGIMTGREAVKQNLGGELICKIT